MKKDSAKCGVFLIFKMFPSSDEHVYFAVFQAALLVFAPGLVIVLKAVNTPTKLILGLLGHHDGFAGTFNLVQRVVGIFSLVLLISAFLGSFLGIGKRHLPNTYRCAAFKRNSFLKAKSLIGLEDCNGFAGTGYFALIAANVSNRG